MARAASSVISSLQKRIDDRIKRRLLAVRRVEDEGRELLTVFVEPRVTVREPPRLDAFAQRVLQALRHNLRVHAPLDVQLRRRAVRRASDVHLREVYLEAERREARNISSHGGEVRRGTDMELQPNTIDRNRSVQHAAHHVVHARTLLANGVHAVHVVKYITGERVKL